MSLSWHLRHGKKRYLAKKNPRGQSKDGSSRTDSDRRGTFSQGTNRFLGSDEMSKDELEMKVKLMQEELRQKLWAQQTYKFKMDEGYEFKL